MLANNETIEDIDLEKEFSRMLSELPWAKFKAAIQSNSRLSKRCMTGGYRFTPKQRHRFERVVIDEARKQEFASQFCNNIFAFWYPVQEELHKTLEDYFHSDEYKQYREEQGLSEDDYVLPDEVFDKYFDPAELDKWRILLCFSPLKFSQEQAQRILHEAEQSGQLVDKVRALEQEVEELRKERDSKEQTLERLESRRKETADELHELRRARRKLNADNKELENRFNSSQAENKRLREELQQKEQELEKNRQQASDVSRKEVDRLQDQVQSLQKELESWQNNYEKQAARNRELNEQLEDRDKQILREQREVQQRDQTINELDSFANLVLQRIDWPRVGSQMKLTPALKRQFNSLMKKLNYEENTGLTLNDTMPRFWNQLMNAEKELVDAVAQSDTREVAEGDVQAYWDQLTDAFYDVALGLEARSILLRMVQEIFYQTFEMEDLENPAVPVKTTASGRTRKNRS